MHPSQASTPGTRRVRAVDRQDTAISDLAAPAPAPGRLRLTSPRGEGVGSGGAYGAVSRVVKESGLLRRAEWFYGALFLFLLAGLGGAAVGVILLGDSWLQLLMAGAFGILFTQFAFLAHEASHRAVARSGPTNDRIGRVIGNFVVGMSYDWWITKHNRHHANPNQIGRDPDIAWDTISFTVEDAARQRGFMGFVTRRQGWLFFPLLMLEGLNLHYLSIKHLVSRGPIKGRWTELALLALRWGIVLTAIFGTMPIGLGFAFLGVQLAVFGVYMGASFAPNHKGMPLIPKDAKVDFFRKQVLTSRNISGGWWATMLFGGLNHQVEHHLFPSMARPHLAKTREIVREHCETIELPYTEVSIGRSYRIVIEYLNRVGLAARDPFDCPMVAQYRRV